MALPVQPLDCAVDSFLARISNRSRGGRRVDFFKNPPGLGNNEWHRGAYNTTIPQGAPKGSTTGLNQQAKNAIFQILLNLTPPADFTQIAYDAWISQMIDQISTICANHSPQTLWTFGRSQKLINIFIKYLVAAYHSKNAGLKPFALSVPWVASITPLAHAPVDRSTLKVVANICGGNTFGYPSNPISWWQKSFSQQLYNQAQCLLQKAAQTKNISRIHYELTHVW
jgi:hypothetical protein